MAENLGIYTPDTPNSDVPEQKEIKIWPYAILWFTIVFLVIGIYYLPEIVQFLK